MHRLAAIPLIYFASLSARAAEDPYRYCTEFFNEAPYTLMLKDLGASFSVDVERKIVTNQAVVRLHRFQFYPRAPLSGNTNIEVEARPRPSDKWQAANLQVEDHGGDPKTFSVTDTYVAGAPHIYRYDFAFRRGVCVPTAVTEIVDPQPKTLYDFDACVRAPNASCEVLPVFRKTLADPDLTAGAAAAPAAEVKTRD